MNEPRHGPVAPASSPPATRILPIVEPDIGRSRPRGLGPRNRRGPLPTLRPGWTGILLAAALLTGGTATGIGVIHTASPVAPSCDVGASQARLTRARHLVTALSLGEATDPRRVMLARDLRALGVTPAIGSGWRQQAVDVSDQLRGITDPTLQNAAVVLAHFGVGPTPADLIQDEPGPVEDMLNVANQRGDGVLGAVEAAGQALSSIPTAPATSSVELPRTSRGLTLTPRRHRDGPQACTQAGESGAEDAGATTGPPVTDESDLTTSAGPRTPTSESSIAPDSGSAIRPPVSSASSAPELSSGSDLSDLPDPSGPSSSATPTPGSNEPVSSSPDPSGTNPGGTDDLQRAADLMDAVADLLRSLSGQASPDAQQLADRLRQVLPDENMAGATPRSSDSPDSITPDMTPSATPSRTAQPSSTVAPSTMDNGIGQPDEMPNDWESRAEDLADQAREAAAGDPLARELASKLEAAGFGNGSGGHDNDAGVSDSRTPNSSTSDSSTPGILTSEPGGADSSTSDPDTGTARPTNGEASPATWERLAQCESSGSWSADTGNGYAGGLQFDPATWTAFGGVGSPSQATREQQIAVAERVRADQGWQAWPRCSQKLGLR